MANGEVTSAAEPMHAQPGDDSGTLGTISIGTGNIAALEQNQHDRSSLFGVKCSTSPLDSKRSHRGGDGSLMRVVPMNQFD